MSAAQKLAARRAIEALDIAPDIAVTDGKWDFVSPSVPAVELVVKADLRCLSVATASILAKVVRDRAMQEVDQQYPEYGFARHKGYPTAEHREILHRIGPCAAHRRSFRPVRLALEARGASC